MNTPEPCVNCEYCYYDSMLVKDVNGYVTCKLDLPIGIRDCPKFKQWHRDISVQFTKFTEE